MINIQINNKQEYAKVIINTLSSKSCLLQHRPPGGKQEMQKRSMQQTNISEVKVVGKKAWEIFFTQRAAPLSPVFRKQMFALQHHVVKIYEDDVIVIACTAVSCCNNWWG